MSEYKNHVGVISTPTFIMHGAGKGVRGMPGPPPAGTSDLPSSRKRAPSPAGSDGSKGSGGRPSGSKNSVPRSASVPRSVSREENCKKARAALVVSRQTQSAEGAAMMSAAAAAIPRSDDDVRRGIALFVDSGKDIDEIFQLVSEAFGITLEIQTSDPDPWSALDEGEASSLLLVSPDIEAGVASTRPRLVKPSGMCKDNQTLNKRWNAMSDIAGVRVLQSLEVS